jgi:hypothetical protein
MKEANVALDDGANDPSVASRTVWIRADAAWLIDQIIPLLPKDMPLVNRIDPNTIEVGSPEFLTLSRSETSQRVEVFVERLTALMNVHSPNTARRFQVHQMLERSITGRQSARASTHITVTPTDGIAELASPADAIVSHVAAFLELARSNKSVAKALSLVREPDVGWGAVYDVIEFLRPYANSKRTYDKEVERYRWTANHYRHLGQNNYPLPQNPPELGEARIFALSRLRQWLDDQLSVSHSGESPPTGR